MPQIYAPRTQFTITDNQVGTRNSTDGTLANITDNDPTTYYETKSAGSVIASENQLTFLLDYTASTEIDTLYIIASGIKEITWHNVTGNDGILFESEVTDTYDNKKALVHTASTIFGTEQMRLRLIKINASSTVKIYSIFQMRRLLNLEQINSRDISRAITRFETSRAPRNSYIIEALDGTRSLQVGSVTKPKRMINYTIWESRVGQGSNIRTVRNNLNQFYNVVQQYPNITIWDLSEQSAEDYEAVFPAYWIPNSFQDRIEGVNAISYSFTVEEQ